MISDQIRQEISRLVNRQYVTLEKRGNSAIKKALTLAKKIGFTNLYIPDVGGWLTYEQFGRELGFFITKIKTDDGLIHPGTLRMEPKSVLLIHSLAGYHKKQPCKELAAAVKRQDALFIEDICGSISLPTYGDIVLGSFGKAKPIDFGTGGFLATDNADYHAYFAQDEIQLEEPVLLQKIKNVKKRLMFLYEKTHELRTALSKKGFHPLGDQHAIVLIVPFDSVEEKAKIITFCNEHSVEFTECPRYIRSNIQAICLEIKRLTQS